MESGLPHVSRNTVQGSLQDASIPRLLESCRKSLVNGRIEVEDGPRHGFIELRAGAVERAGFDDLSGPAALERLRALHQGSYEISQRLPDLDGQLGTAAAFRGELTEVSLIELMRHCEDNALTCSLILIHEFDRGEIEYVDGDIVRVKLNGEVDEDRIVDMVRLRDARFLVKAPPLPLGVFGWPVIRRDPTEPFQIGHLAARPRARRADPYSEPVWFDNELEPAATAAGEIDTATALAATKRQRARTEPAATPPRRGWLRRVIGHALDRVRRGR